MYISLLLAIFCSASGILSSSENLPCKVSDLPCIENFVKTVQPKIISGIPELEVKSSDPLFIEKIEGNLSVLKYKFFNTTLNGYKDCKVANISVNENISKVHYDLNCGTVTMRGKYEINGKLVIVPVEGKGDYSMIAGKYSIHVESDLKKNEGDDGKTYITIKNFKLKCIPLTGSRFEFKNLFNGRKDLSDAVHKFAHENWLEVAELVQDPIWNACIKKMTININKYLKQVPLEDMLPK